MSDRGKGRANRLIEERSPYLLQHAHNPVDWYPWGEEAFARAKEEDRPVFLSVGYSTCHWCHVMAHESFEDERVAELMNGTFVCVKVDREERPDVDGVYMSVCQLMTGGGGWPLTVIMTPEKKAFFSGTYFPRETRYGRIGMLELIPRIRALWTEERFKVDNQAEQIAAALALSVGGGRKGELTESVVESAFVELASMYDAEHGGFGTRPKFPSPHNLLFLLRMWRHRGRGGALEMVERTLERMRRGGIFDHLGFGFHRYSTDAAWVLPHFEKMLYDQAMLAMAYTEAFQATGRPFFRRTAEEILEYVLRDMASPEGGFHSAEDADSEGEEGKYYVWSEEEIRRVLSPREAEAVIRVYGIEAGGNYSEEATGEKTGSNILFMGGGGQEAGRAPGSPEEELSSTLAEARSKLLAARLLRVRPQKDDKLLTDWNGLMVAALAKAAKAFGEERYSEAARRAARFLIAEMKTSGGRLLHRYRQGQKAFDAFLDDYAFVIWGLIELYEAVLAPAFLGEAIRLCDTTVRHFWDDRNGGFFHTADDAEVLPVRKKELYDGAIPSGNSVMLLNLLRLGKMTGEGRFLERADALEQALAPDVTESPAAFTMFLAAVDFRLSPGYEIVIAGVEGAEDTGKMLDAVRSAFAPSAVLLFRPQGPGSEEIESIAAFTGPLVASGGRATAYLCRDYSCSLPTRDVEELMRRLGS